MRKRERGGRERVRKSEKQREGESSPGKKGIPVKTVLK